MSAPVLILELESDRLFLVEAKLSGLKPRVLRVHSVARPDARADTPAEPARDDPNAGESADELGAWIRAQLDEHGFRAKQAIVAVSRAHIVTKHLDPPAESLSATERHEMIRLQMSRQASLTSADSVIDYTQAPGDGAITAAAMPAERVARRQRVAKAAGLRLTGILLRSAGLRALLHEPPADSPTGAADRDGGADAGSPRLVVAPGVGSVEILIVADGEIVFSRSIAAEDSSREAPEALARRLAVEAARTVVSFRVALGGADVTGATVIAGEPLARSLTAALSERLDIPTRAVAPEQLIDFDDAVAQQDRAPAAPLAGLLLCAKKKLPVLDFANPTAPPDTRASLRQAVLVGLLLIIVLGGAGYLLAQDRLASERAALEVIKADHAGAQSKWVQAQLDAARLGHIRAWSDSGIDWLAHLAAVIEDAPDPESAALTELSAELRATAAFQAGKQIGDPDAWRSDSTLVFRIAGIARDRHHAQAFRQRLLESDQLTVSSQGPEVENRFAFVVSTDRPGPVPPSTDAPQPEQTGEGVKP